MQDEKGEREVEGWVGRRRKATRRRWYKLRKREGHHRQREQPVQSTESERAGCAQKEAS